MTVLRECADPEKCKIHAPAKEILLVGESNPYGADPAMALYPLPERAAGGRLAAILGLSRGEYLRRFDRVNLLQATRSKWSVPRARDAAAAILAGRKWRKLVLLGSRVAAAFGLKNVPFESTWAAICEGAPSDVSDIAPEVRAAVYPGAVLALVLPHPSGLCRAWNEPGAAERARAAVTRLEAAQ